jgi:DNA-directed RNA polymerase II subunit RPB1
MGRRVPKTMNYGKRTTPHYPLNAKLELEQKYESRGFIASSYIQGMNPREYFFHSMTGREGVCDTAMGTSKSGYIQRRLIKLMEDMKIEYDGTVRDSTGKIYQFVYNEDGFDPAHMVKVDGKRDFCNVTRIVDRLNLEYELEKKKT